MPVLPSSHQAAVDPRGGTPGRILDAAEELFAERGFAGSAVRDIAARAGLNAASLYNHFPGKQELYEAVLDRGLQPVFELLGDIVTAERSADRDEWVMDALVDYFAERPNLARLLHHEALGGAENIARLAGRWLEPIYSRGVDALRTRPGLEGWAPADLPLLVLAMHNLILCYFSMAPLFEKLLGQDPLAPAALARQKHFLREATRRLIAPGVARPAAPTSRDEDDG